jgi:excisionase family DNA binding protein
MPVTTERYLTVQEVAAELRVSVRTVYRALARRDLPSVRLAPLGQIRIPADALERLGDIPTKEHA